MCIRVSRYSVSHYNGKTYTTVWYDECSDVMMTKINNNGNIDWLHILPKRQLEVIGSASSYTGFNSYFIRPSGSPFYGGIGVVALPQLNKTLVLFNDNPKNATVLNIGERFKVANKFNNTDCFMLNIDNSTGKYTRKPFFSNEDIPPALVRHGVQFGNNFYMVGMQVKLLGKSKIVVGKATFK